MNLKQAQYGDYKQKRKKQKVAIAISSVFLICALVQLFCTKLHQSKSIEAEPVESCNAQFEIPSYTGNPYVEVNGNTPFFQDIPITTDEYELYSSLDSLGRCGPAIGCIGIETMPTDERGLIGMIKPSGWHTIRYDDIIEDKYLYNRCHLIAYMLSGENDNELNLFTGTRYLNIIGMLPFENRVANYIKSTSNHVLYRVTPIFEGSNLVASGVLIEAQSIEDFGDGIQFNVYVYNVQPGIAIDYLTGESKRVDESNSSEVPLSSSLNY